MSLGLTRDSVLDLANLAEEANNRRLATAQKEKNSSIQTSQTQLEEGESAEVLLEPAGEETAQTKPPQKRDPQPSYGQYSGFTVDQAHYEQYRANPYGYTVDPYAPVLLGGKKKEKKNVFCCFFAPWGGTDQARVAPDRETNLERKPEVDGLFTKPEVEVEKADDDEQPGEQKGEEVEPNKEEDGPIGTKRKGILRRTNVVTTAARMAASETSNTKGSRRSLFPQYEEKPKNSKKHHCRFAPMARVVAVKSLKDMTNSEKADIWWQKKDYEDFKKTGRIIAKAMLEGGSEVWLATNKSWQLPKLGIFSSRNTSENVASTRSYHLMDRNSIAPDGDRPRSEDSDKWWHKFGHSRRGLEHIASIEEGRQRQANVRLAVRAVVDEQKRQRIYRKRDPEKLRMLSLQYTTWARDLALAAAASDAEAVEGNFQPDRKTREFYLLKQAKANGGFSSQIPAFMLPTVMTPQMLDANTSSQLRFKRKQSAPVVKKEPNQLPEGNTLEAIRDPQPDSSSMAKRAAGFGTESGANMAAVLSGMGTVGAQ